MSKKTPVSKEETRGSNAIKSQFIRWGTRLVMRWDVPERLKEIGVHLQQWFGSAQFWQPVSTIDKKWTHDHPEEHYIWVKFTPQTYRGYLLFFPYHGRNWSILLICGETPGSYELYFLKFRLANVIYQGTWWVVELQQSSNASQPWKLWLEDCWFMCGQDLRGMKPTERNQFGRESMEKHWQPDSALESVELKWKPVCLGSQFPYLLDFLTKQTNLDLMNVRFWFSSNNENKTNRENVLLTYSWTSNPSNWSRSLTMTEEFRKKEEAEAEKQKIAIQNMSDKWTHGHRVFACWRTIHYDIYELSTLDREGDHGIIIGRACVPNIQISTSIEKWFKKLDENTNVLWIIGEWHSWFGSWVPVRLANPDEVDERLRLPKSIAIPEGQPPKKFWLERRKWFSIPAPESFF